MKKSFIFSFIFILIAFFQNCGSYDSLSTNSILSSDYLDSIAETTPQREEDLPPQNHNNQDDNRNDASMSQGKAFEFDGLPNVNFTTKNSAQVEWAITDFGQGQVAYGETKNLENVNTPETRYIFNKHQQMIFGLKPKTTYYYQVKSTNQAGIEIKSDIFNFETLPDNDDTGSFAPGPIVDGWNDNLPLGGRAIGVVTYGLTTGNARLVSHKSSRRFLATRSGLVKSFAYLNRVLTKGDIERRAVVKRNTEPVWYEMQQALGNDPMRGGYMLSNSYSVGNGGLQEVTLQTDSGAPDHHPSGKVIATSRRFIPFELPIEQAVHIKFNQVGRIEAGKIYHLVFHNLTPPDVGLRNLSAEQAKNAPVNKGAISLDGAHQGHLIDHPSDRQGPFMRDIAGTLTKESASSSWQKTNVNAFFSITYSDDVEVGEMYAHIHGQGAYKYYVDGKNQMRQKLTWEYPDIRVDRVVTRFGHTSSANGQPMNIVIKNQSFQTIATAAISFDPILKKAAQSSSWFINNQTRHAVSQLSQVTTLIKGQTYYIEYSAASGAGYVMSPALDPMLTRHGSKDSNMTANAFAQQSSNSGESWRALNAFPGGDLAMYLIPVGVPTKTPLPD